MSKCKNLNLITKEEWSILKKKGKVYPRSDDWNPYPKPLYLYSENKSKGVCWFPFALCDFIDCESRKSSEFEKDSFQPTRPLLTSETDPLGLDRDQKTVFKEIIEKLLLDQRVFLNFSTGYGKSAITVHITSKVKRGKRLILVYNSGVQKQWVKDVYKKFSNAKIQHIQAKKPIDPDANVYVMGLRKASNCFNTCKGGGWADDSKYGNDIREFFKSISMLVIDEVDQLPTKMLINIMKHINPVYLIGLSATINRDDNMHQALYAYFGPRKTFIKRFIVKDFDVIKYQTNFEPDVVFDDYGKINNVVMVDSIAYNEERHKMICKLVKEYKNDKILMLSKRVDEIDSIFSILEKDGESVDYKHQHKTSWDTNKRVLVGGFGSCGRGVDIPGLTLLILLSSVNHIEQNEGRIRAKNNKIIDIVDKHPIFERRWNKLRRVWYVKRGATLYVQNDGESEIKLLTNNIFTVKNNRNHSFLHPHPK